MGRLGRRVGEEEELEAEEEVDRVETIMNVTGNVHHVL